MTEKRKALGRGLESLLPPRPLYNVPSTFSPTTSETGGLPGTDSSPAAEVTAATTTALRPGETVQELALAQLDPNPYQIRATMDQAALAELRESIAAMGVIEPIIVRPAANGRYSIVAGERRWKAVRMAHRDTVPAVVRNMSNQQAMEMTIVENLQREDLGIMDQARAYHRLASEFGLTQDDVAERTGKERSTVANYLRLLKLPDEVQGLIDKGDLSFGHAKVLMTMPPSAAALMAEMAQRIIKRGLTVRQTEEAVTNLVQARPAAKKERIVDPNVRQAEETLRRALGVRVMINDKRGRGKITLQYRSLEDFDRIMEAITGE
jgi:ParB family transcriptional regulator, chromosome partitioning protein